MARILLIEDAEILRSSLREMLEHYGHEVIEAVDGNEGERLLTEGSYDLGIFDIWLPGKNGLTLLDGVKERLEDMPIIVISGGSPKTSVELSATLAKVHGASEVLFKPFENVELLAAIDRLFSRG